MPELVQQLLQQPWMPQVAAALGGMHTGGGASNSNQRDPQQLLAGLMQMLQPATSDSDSVGTGP